MAAVLMDKLKVNKKDGKKGSRVRVDFGEEERKAFHAIKERLRRSCGCRLSTLTAQYKD